MLTIAQVAKHYTISRLRLIAPTYIVGIITKFVCRNILAINVPFYEAVLLLAHFGADNAEHDQAVVVQRDAVQAHR